jgi:hypothetical protein
VIVVVIPHHLRTLAGVGREVTLEIEGPVTQRACSTRWKPASRCCGDDARSHTLKRRAFIRFFACGQDLSHESPDAPLPEAVVSGAEPFMVVGAMAGG